VSRSGRVASATWRDPASSFQFLQDPPKRISTMQKLTGQDALFLHLDLPHAASHVTMIYLYDQSGLAKPLRFRQIVGHIDKRLDVSPMFRRRIVQPPLAYPYWTDDPDFDIDFHVRHMALPKPGDWRQFQIMAARIHARPLDLTRPPWEMYVIEGLDNAGWLPKGSFALVTKIHHAAVDGTAATELTWALHDVLGAKGRPTPVPVKQKDVRKLQAAPSFTNMVTRIVVDNLAAPLKLAGPLSRALPKLSVATMKLLSRALFSSESGVPRTRFNQPVSSQRVFESVPFDLARLKPMRAAVPGATVNDVVLAIIGGAMRRYLKSKKELPGNSLMALAPVNTRQAAGERQTTGNAISFLTFPLASNIADPIARIAKVREATAQTKALSNAIGAHDLTDISKHTPPATLAFAGRLATMTGLGGKGPLVLHNCIVTNVPGPNAELAMLGARLRYFSGVAPITDGVGAIFAVTSLNGRMFISLTSCPEMVPDPAFFGDCIRGSILEMEAAARAATALPLVADKRRDAAPKRPRRAAKAPAAPAPKSRRRKPAA
jgi:diacylglycerol O-acyltransferase